MPQCGVWFRNRWHALGMACQLAQVSNPSCTDNLQRWNHSHFKRPPIDYGSSEEIFKVQGTRSIGLLHCQQENGDVVGRQPCQNVPKTLPASFTISNIHRGKQRRNICFGTCEHAVWRTTNASRPYELSSIVTTMGQLWMNLKDGELPLHRLIIANEQKQ